MGFFDDSKYADDADDYYDNDDELQMTFRDPRCKTCGCLIEWQKNQNGKWVPYVGMKPHFHDEKPSAIEDFS